MARLIPLLASFFIIGIAELGDKTQFLVLVLASKYPMEKVIYGVVSATATLMLIAVLVGAAVHRLIPPIFISIIAGAFFIIYGMNMIRPLHGTSEKESEDKPVKSKGPFVAVFSSLFIAELGDKTQLATFAIASKYNSPLMVWLGATLGMIVVNLFGIAIGNLLKGYLPERILNYIAGVIFVLFGLVTFLGMVLRI